MLGRLHSCTTHVRLKRAPARRRRPCTPAPHSSVPAARRQPPAVPQWRLPPAAASTPPTVATRLLPFLLFGGLQQCGSRRTYQPQAQRC